MKVAVTGAGGMIGGFLTQELLKEGHEVTAIDIKPRTEWLQVHDAADNFSDWDLSNLTRASIILRGFDEVYLLAADMGGIGHIETHQFQCIDSVAISRSIIKAAIAGDCNRVFYSSSACAYPINQQQEVDCPPLKEEDAWQGRAEYGYGEEKLFTESYCEFAPIETRIARYHNVYAPYATTFEGGREKAPAAICRKVAEAILNGSYEISIWGDGEQTRSFMHVDDCVEGTLKIMRSDYSKPLNLGSDRLVTINELVSIVENIAGVELKRNYDLDAPKGVRGRNSDNTLIRKTLDWEPSISLETGLEQLYSWVYGQIKDRF